MPMFAGLDVGGKRTAVCVMDDAGKIAWRGLVDTHPEMIDAALERFKAGLINGGHEDPTVEPHSRGAQDIRPPAWRNARIAFRSEGRTPA